MEHLASLAEILRAALEHCPENTRNVLARQANIHIAAIESALKAVGGNPELKTVASVPDAAADEGRS